MIDNIYDEIRTELLKLKLKEAKDYFDIENIPDSIIDDSFTMGLLDIEPGTRAEPKNNIPVFNLLGTLRINIAKKIPADNIIKTMKLLTLKIQEIVNFVLLIDVGSDEKDDINFVGSASTVEGTILVAEITFNFNYRFTKI